ncbi:MAG: capsule assembly Wzi family protein [Paludibacter sp.]
MKKLLFLIAGLIVSVIISAQDIPEHISYTRIYDFLDELATDGIFELNSVAKPYSRSFIAGKLVEAENNKSLNTRQRKELRFFKNEFALELKRLPDNFLEFRYKTSTLALLQPAYNYQDTSFRARITPILGMHVTVNGNGAFTKRWYGADFQGMIGKNFSVYGSLRDLSIDASWLKNNLPVSAALLARPSYLNDYPGYEYKESSQGGDFSDSRGGIKYSWNWGSVGLVKDNVVWGDNYHGSNILSGRAPSFPMLTLHLKPVSWFEMQYIHGWLVSNVLDSTRYYIDNTGAKEYRMSNKFIAANLFTFTPVRNLNLSIGNSIIYAEPNIQAAYFIPIAFYKSEDHTLTKGLAIENQNSQVFLNISSRNIKHLHLFTSIYADEISWSRFMPSSKERNPISYKVGANLSNFPLANLSLIAEYTNSNIINYKHSIPAITWASNGYNLGSYLGDNSTELYLAARYKPFQGVDLSFSYSNAKHGNEYIYDRAAIRNIISQPSLGDITWSNQSLAFDLHVEIINNVYAFANVTYSDIKGYNLTSTSISGEIRKDAQGYLDLFTPKYLQGKNTTLSFGMSFGF